jgi:hypothetical protein
MANDLEKFLNAMYPNHGKLHVDKNGELSTIIVDADTDGFVCKFNHDDCVEIDTKEMSYISLDIPTLKHLINLIIKAEKIYNNRTEEEWENYSIQQNS